MATAQSRPRWLWVDARRKERLSGKSGQPLHFLSSCQSWGRMVGCVASFGLESLPFSTSFARYRMGIPQESLEIRGLLGAVEGAQGDLLS